MVNIRHDKTHLSIGVGFSKVEEIIPSFEVRAVKNNIFCLFIGNDAGVRKPELVLANLNRDTAVENVTKCICNTVETFSQVFPNIQNLTTSDKLNIRLAIQTHIARLALNKARSKINLI